MTKTKPPVNGAGSGTIAPIKNVALFTGLVARVVNRKPQLPGFGVFKGRAGLGKSFAAMYAINAFRAYHLEVLYSWTQKTFCEMCLKEMGVALPGSPTVATMVAAISEHLADTRRPLIVDEADHLERRNIIEVVRDIYRGCADAGGSIVMIGEEQFPAKLERWERVHSRVLAFVSAAPSDVDDARHLAQLYCDKVKVEDDLLAKLVAKTNGSARRIVIGLEYIQETALAEGWRTIAAERWGDRPLLADGAA